MEYSKTVEGRSSLFKVEIKKGSCVFRYNVEIKCKAGKRELLLCKQNEIHLRNAQNLACRKLVQVACEATDGFGVGKENIVYCYDGRFILYSTQKLEILSIDLKSSDISYERLEYGVKSDQINVSLTLNESSPKLNYSDFSSSLVTGNDFKCDHSVRTFLEIVTSNHLINSGQFQNGQTGTIYQTRPTTDNFLVNKSLTPGMLMFDGMQKGARIVDNKTAFLILDLKRCLNFGAVNQNSEQLPLSEIYKQFEKKYKNDTNNKFEKFFKGVRMLISYDNSRTVCFDSLSEKPVSDAIFNVEEQSLSQFYKKTHSIILNNAKMPGAHAPGGKERNIVYPLEVLYVLPGQLISQEKHDIPLENSVKASERYEFIMRQVELLSSGPTAEYLKNHRTLPKIRINDKNGKEKQIVPVSKDGSFFKDICHSSLLVSKNLLKKWVLVYETDTQLREIEQFIETITKTADDSGFTLPPPVKKCQIELHELEQVFINAEKDRIQLILYVDDQSHSPLLKTFEAKYKILTQQLRPKSIEGRIQTIKNIVLKFNSKCFGINFMPAFGPNMNDLDLEKNPNLLVIGYDVSHPTNGSPMEIYHLNKNGYSGFSSSHPSVVGICANKNAHLGAFSGDFFYQESRREELSSARLVKAIKDIIVCAHKTSMKTAKPNRKPTRLIIIRDGISEGQYKMAIERELESIKLGYSEGMKELKDENLAKTHPKITFIVGTKRHNKRFFHFENGEISNTRPGDVVDTEVIRQDGISEFFLQTHHPIFGSAKTTQYDILVNELNISKLKLEEFMLVLANMHQISGCPTSIPLPIYLADETATRGQEIYQQVNHFLRIKEQSEDLKAEIPQFIEELEKPSNLNDYFDKLTETFGYAGSKLAETRFNS
ncbi:Germ cell-expressed protein R06C7.1 [Aphelenchoides bicaudatus]|nr:Germ cell-expressed protein R06C7.1 [Aphelenchoides bicaudatus]